MINKIVIGHTDPAKDMGKVLLIDMSVVPKVSVDKVLDMMREIGIMFYDGQPKGSITIWTGTGGLNMFNRLHKNYRLYHRLMRNYTKPRIDHKRLKYAKFLS